MGAQLVGAAGQRHQAHPGGDLAGTGDHPPARARRLAVVVGRHLLDHALLREGEVDHALVAARVADTMAQ